MKLKEITISANTGLDAIKRAPIVDEYTGLKCLRIQDISQNKEYDDWGNTKTTENDYKKFKLRIDDLLVARTGATVGVSYLVRKDLNAVFNNGSIRLKFSDKADARYVYYVFQTKSFNQYIDNVSCVATQPNLRVETLLKFNIPDYNINIQRRIASILSTYDNLIENNNRRIHLLEQMAENLYKEWFVRFRFPGHEKVEMENGLPKGWKYERLDTIASINMGQSPPSSFYNEEQKGLPFHQGVGSYGDIYLKDEIYSTQGAKVAESNSIIFSVRAPVGRINITLNKIYLGRGVAAINSLNGNNGFLYWSLRSKFAKEDTIGNGAIFSSVTRDELGRQKMIVPDKNSVIKFESVANKMENLIRDITNQNKSLTRQRDLLLPRLMSGKLEVKE